MARIVSGLRLFAAWATVVAACLSAGRGEAAFEKGGLVGQAPRATALGGVSTALTWDAVSARGIPAGLAHLAAPHVVAGGGVVSGASANVITVGAGGMIDGLGLAVVATSEAFDDGFERACGLGVGFPIDEIRWLSIGVEMKAVSADLDGVSGLGFGFDASALVRGRLPWYGIEVDGVAGVEDAMGSLKWDDGLREDLDSQARIGVGVRWGRNLALHSELRLIRGPGRAEKIAAIGLEREFRIYGVPLAVRTGWRDGERREASFGGGFGGHVGPVSADYALVSMTQSQGYIHAFSLTWAFGDVGVPMTRWVVKGARGGVSASAPVLKLNSVYDVVHFDIDPPRDYHRVTSWAVLVIDGTGEAVWSSEGEGLPPSTVRWDGAMDSGPQAAGGQYSCQLLLRGPGAYRYMSVPSGFRIERTPEGDLAPDPLDPDEFDTPLLKN